MPQKFPLGHQIIIRDSDAGGSTGEGCALAHVVSWWGSEDFTVELADQTRIMISDDIMTCANHDWGSGYTEPDWVAAHGIDDLMDIPCKVCGTTRRQENVPPTFNDFYVEVTATLSSEHGCSSDDFVAGLKILLREAWSTEHSITALELYELCCGADAEENPLMKFLEAKYPKLTKIFQEIAS